MMMRLLESSIQLLLVPRLSPRLAQRHRRLHERRTRLVDPVHKIRQLLVGSRGVRVPDRFVHARKGHRRIAVVQIGRELQAAEPGPTHEALGSCQPRSEEHTSELQSQSNLVCRLLLEKKNKK